MLVMNVIAEILKREGVSTLFCFPTTSIIEAAAAVGIRPVICRQERVGVHMADGFARVSNGRPPGVFAMQYGPGAENAFAGVATAFSDSSPVVFLPLGHPRETAQLFPMFKSSRTYASITKSVEEVILPEQVANIMRRAFSASGLSHFSITTKVSGPNLAWKLPMPSASTAGPYSMQPCSA